MNTTKKLAHLLSILIIVSFYSSVLLAQGTAQKLERSNPHDAIWVHLYYLQSGHYQPEVSSQAFVGGDSLTRVKWAIQLKQVLDGNGLYVHMNQLPMEADYEDSVTHRQYYTPFPDELPEVYLEKTENQWHYSAETCQSIPALHQRTYPLGTDRLINLFGDRSGQKFLGLSGWQYLGILVLLAIGGLLYFIFSLILGFLIRKGSSVQLSSITDFPRHVHRVANVGSMLLIVWALRLMFPLLLLPIKVSAFIHTSLRILMTVILVLVALRLLNLLIDYLESITMKTESKMDDQLIPVVEQIFRIIVIGIGVIQVLNLLNLNVTALIAGVSIGGLALALAAQDTVKNFLGSVMIFTDRPFQIGDWVEGNGFMGSVVQVGFRTTRIRMPDTSIISVPNGSMANVNVTNKGVREYRLFQSTAGVTYDTPPDLIEEFVRGIKEILKRHPEVPDNEDDIYVYFTEMADFSLNIFIRAYMIAPTYADELRIKESIQLAILRWAEALEVRFAFPSSTMYIEEMPGQPSLMPTYKTDRKSFENAWKDYFEHFDERFKVAGPDGKE